MARRWEVTFRSSDFNSRRDQRPSRSLHPIQQRPRPTRSAATAMRRVAAAAPATPSASEQDTGQRECARGEWCEARTVTIDDDGRRQVQPWLGYQAFCPADELLIETNLRKLPHLYRVLWGELGNPKRGGQVIHVPFGPRIPIRVDVEALMRRYSEVLVSWEERVRLVVGLTELDTDLSRKRRDVRAIDQAVDVLKVNIGPLLALPAETMTRTRRDELVNDDEMDGAQAGLEILTLEYLGRAYLGITDAKPEQIIGVPCPQCERLSLRRSELWEKGDLNLGAACMLCGKRLTIAEYDRLIRDRAKAAREARRRPTLANLPAGVS